MIEQQDLTRQKTYLRHDRAPRDHGEPKFTATGPRLRHRLPLGDGRSEPLDCREP